MAMMETISARNVVRVGRIGVVLPPVVLAPSRAYVHADCRSTGLRSGKNEWTALTSDNGRTEGRRIRLLAKKRGPSRPNGLESRRSVQQEERKEDSEGGPSPSPSNSGSSDEDLSGEVVDAEFQTEETAKVDEKPTTTTESPDDIGKGLSELRKERVASGVQDPANTTDFWQGVAEETKLIEWPALPKVLGTTGVVVAMILGSSVVLLTVNAILAEGSDFLFTNPAFKEFARGTLNLYW